MRPRPCLPEETRFWRHVTRRSDAECWTWEGGTTKGYGVFWAGVRREGTAKAVWAHRWAWESAHGPIPARLQLDHLCQNPACVNTAHLEVVTQRENILRGTSPAAQHARATTCAHGHPWDDANTLARNGVRHCRECNRARMRARAPRETACCPVCGGPMRPTSRTCRRCSYTAECRSVQSMLALDLQRISGALE